MAMIDPSYLLVLNAGSSSLKFELFAQQPTWRSHLRGAVTNIGRPGSSLERDGDATTRSVDVADHGAATRIVTQQLFDGPHAIDRRRVVATGHRVVHGGEFFSAPTLIEPSVIAQLESIADLAPLHNPPTLAVLRSVQQQLPGVPMVAMFDTAFFRDLPEHAAAYAIPHQWRQRYRIRRYGFHGIAHEYLYRRYLNLTRSDRAPQRVISVQLGQGCSATALLDGRPVETSMGFTPLEGLIMGTRAGDLDAGVVLHLARQGLSWQSLEDVLNRKSGLLGLSNASDDVRELLRLEQAQHPGARLAMAAFCHRIRKYLGAYAAVLGGLDAVLFGGGIGENAPLVRSRVCEGLEWLGLDLDEEANAGCIGTETRISSASSRIEVFVIPVREEEAIARATLACIGDNETSDGLFS